MGIIKHDTIVVTSSHSAMLEAAYRKADELGLPLTEITPPVLNGYRTFCITPDGSKEGWLESDNGDRQREEWKTWVKSLQHREMLCVDWAHVSFGGDYEEQAALLDHNGKKKHDGDGL